MPLETTKAIGDEVGKSLSLATQFFDTLKNQVLSGLPTFTMKFLWIALLFIIFRPISKGLLHTIDLLLEKRKVDPLLKTFSLSFIKILINLVFFFLFIGGIGVKATSLVTVLGTAGLAIGLALQGSLSNLAGGFLILLFKPFAKGDFIITDSGTGTVDSIYILYTTILTLDNSRIVIPNKDLANAPVTNLFANQERMLDLIFSASYDNDVELVKATLTKIAETHSKVLHDRGYTIRLKTQGSSSLDYVFRVWVKTEDYWNVYYDITESVKKEFDANNIEIPYNKLDVYQK